jgi:branched-chain amino acid transport system permease protein
MLFINQELIAQLLLSVAITTSLYLLSAISLSLVETVFKTANLAHGQLIIIGAYVFYSLDAPQVNYFTICASLVVLACVTTFVLKKIFIEPFLSHSTELVLLSTLILSLMLDTIILLIWGATTLSLPETQTHIFKNLFTVNTSQVISMLSACILPACGYILFNFTPLGRALRAVSENSVSASSIGLPKSSQIFLVLFCSTILAFFTGILIAYDTALVPNLGFTFTFKAMAIVILAGNSNFIRMLYFSFLLSLIENVVLVVSYNSWSLPAIYRDAVSYCFLCGYLMISPRTPKIKLTRAY